MSNTPEVAPNFIRHQIADDLAAGKNDSRLVTRFPPEPNGYLHIGHAKSICLNFGLALEHPQARCHLRFDDTNPANENMEFVQSIQDDVRWLGFDWQEHLYFASDYFETLYELATQLIQQGDAYVCSLNAEDMRKLRGTLTEPGQNSPFRDRSIEENLQLFADMRSGKFADGAHALRAKIDMTSGNINLRDPVLYRIRRQDHFRLQDSWCIYPMYDFTHPISDALESVTHSLCTLEFEDHRPLYDWVLDHLSLPYRPQQIEFSRLSLAYTVTSKRKLKQLVEENCVKGWDDPRMPTLTGLRRRGCPAAAIRDFAERIGVTKKDSVSEMSLLENCIREDLDSKTQRVMAVLKPLKIIIDNLPEDHCEWLDAPFHPNKPEMGSRKIPFTREIVIEQDDFMLEPVKKFFRLAPGKEVRLRYAYFIRCESVVTDPDTSQITELHCVYDPETKGGNAPDGRKVKGTLHWVSANYGKQAEVRLYDRLFNQANPGQMENFLDAINPDSLEILSDSLVEPYLTEIAPEHSVQFERLGYFCADRHDHRSDRPVYNRTVSLRDSWGKLERQQQNQKK